MDPTTIERDRHRRAIRTRLTALIEGEQPFDLVRGALLVAAEEYPGLDLAEQAARVREIGRDAARRVEGLTNPFARLDTLRCYLFEELGFCGNLDDYNDPRNSFLNEVLDRRTGIPLTLSILFIEVARASGFEARGIGLPGYFVAGVGYDGRSILVDPFHGGHVITEEDCRRLVARSTGRAALFRREQLDGCSELDMLRRMLVNLKGVYLSREAYLPALSCVERLLLISPQDLEEIRDRGFLLAHLGLPGAALADLEAYLSLDPSAPDAASVRGRVAWLRRRMTETN